MEKEPQQRHKPAPEALSTSKVTRAKFLQYMGWSGASLAGVFLKDSLFNRYESSEYPIDRSQISQQIINVSESLKSFCFEVFSVNNRGDIINRQQRQARYFSEEIGNGISLEMVEIPGGNFLMGSPQGEGYDEEKPQHRVTIQPLYMGKYAITQAQWKVVAALPKVKIDLKSDPSKFKGANRPVESVNWYEAEEFCQRLSQKTGKQYRLPSEAQWEYACRAGTNTPFHFGETITPELVNYDGNYPYGNAPKGTYREQTVQVGTLPPNGFGLFEMHGNVYEWCADHWHSDYNGAPNDGTIWLYSNEYPLRVVRGGNLSREAYRCRSDSRHFNLFDHSYLPSTGFRVLLSSRTSY